MTCQILIKNPDGETLAACPYIVNPIYSRSVNRLAQITFTIPSDSYAAQFLTYPNEAWVYQDGKLVDIFKITEVQKSGG